MVSGPYGTSPIAPGAGILTFRAMEEVLLPELAGMSVAELSSTIQQFAAERTQPSPEFMKAWNNEMVGALASEPAAPWKPMVQALFAFGKLRVTPCQELLETSMKKAKTGPKESNGVYLQALAMIDAQKPDTINKADAASLFAAAGTGLLERPEQLESYHLAARYFGQTEYAEQAYSKLGSTNAQPSATQEKFAAILKNAAAATHFTSRNNIRIEVLEEQPAPFMGTPVDILVRASDAQGNMHQLWIEIDGPLHDIKTASGEEIINGTGLMQDVSPTMRGRASGVSVLSEKWEIFSVNP